MHLIHTLLLSAVITLVTSTAFAVEINTNSSFGFAEGSLSGLQGVGFSGNFNYDTSGVLAPHVSVHELGAPAGGQFIVHGFPQFSFSFHGLDIWVENDQVFDGFGVIPAGLVDNYLLTGFAPGASYNLSSHSIMDGFAVSLADLLLCILGCSKI